MDTVVSWPKDTASSYTAARSHLRSTGYRNRCSAVAAATECDHQHETNHESEEVKRGHWVCKGCATSRCEIRPSTRSTFASQNSFDVGWRDWRDLNETTTQTVMGATQMDETRTMDRSLDIAPLWLQTHSHGSKPPSAIPEGHSSKRTARVGSLPCCCRWQPWRRRTKW